jgi:hypothetical protein
MDLSNGQVDSCRLAKEKQAAQAVQPMLQLLHFAKPALADFWQPGLFATVHYRSQQSPCMIPQACKDDDGLLACNDMSRSK